MAEHPNVNKFRKGWEAFQSGDMEALRGLIAPDCIWHVGGNNILSGDYKGIDDILAFFARSAQETNGTLRFEIHDILANDAHAVALVNGSAERGGKRLAQRGTHIVHLTPDGRVGESWFFSEDSAVNDDFWS